MLNVLKRLSPAYEHGSWHVDAFGNDIQAIVKTVDQENVGVTRGTEHHLRSTGPTPRRVAG
jgi:hypothetical protein